MKKKAVKVFCILVIAMFLVIQLYPIAWLFMASVKTSAELGAAPFALPKAVTFGNYSAILEEGKMLLYMWNSIKVTFCSIVFILVLSSTAGYALAKFNFRVNKKVYAFFTFGIMIPVQITLIPLFCFYSKMGILNTTMSLVVPQIGFALPLSVMLFVSFYSFVPNELIEAAIMDGCSLFRIFGQIVFPLAKNTVFTIALMYTILIWNDFIFANTFISENTAKTIAVGLKDYVGAFGNVDWGKTYAAIAFSIIPPMIVYFMLNKYVTAGMTMGATKG